MLQPETIARGRLLSAYAHNWVRRLTLIEQGVIEGRALRSELLVLAEHLREWQQWVEDLEKELAAT